MNPWKPLAAAVITMSATTIAHGASATEFKYGGFIQLDASFSDYSEGKPGNRLIEDFLVPSLIPVETSNDADAYQSMIIHAKTSRLFFKTKTNTDAGDISTHIEMDFMLSGAGDERISNSWNPRLRHAYVQWDYAEDKSVLAGQTWSTFFNVGALPDLLDFVGPVGTLFNRQPMIRWTSGGIQLALENPATRLNGDATQLDDAETVPDLIARYNGTSGDLAWSLAGMLRQLNYEDRSDAATVSADDTSMGYALSLAGKYALAGGDDIRFMLNYGDALGRYMSLNGFNDGYVAANGDIETIDQMGLFIAYRHNWNAHWRSNFSYSMSEADNPDTADFAGAASLAKSYSSFHANINYLPAPGLQLGSELMLASKELENGAEGDLTRLQFAVKYAF